MLTVEPVRAYNSAYVKYPSRKYIIVIINKYGVIFSKLIIPLSVPSGKNKLLEIIAVTIISNICIKPIELDT